MRALLKKHRELLLLKPADKPDDYHKLLELLRGDVRPIYGPIRLSAGVEMTWHSAEGWMLDYRY